MVLDPLAERTDIDLQAVSASCGAFFRIMETRPVRTALHVVENASCKSMWDAVAK